MYLAKINPHPRDDKISFEEENHIYQVGSDQYTSMTTIIHSQFSEFNAKEVIRKMKRSQNWPNSKYFGKSDQEIADEWEKNRVDAANAGTQMHAQIECFLNDFYEGIPPTVPSTPEFQQFLNFYRDFGRMFPQFKPFRTEWRIYHEKARIAGTIDYCMINGVGEIIILDWKRSKEIKKENKYQRGKGPFSKFEDCNYNHYTCQLNGYAYIIETCYQMKVIGMFLAIFHPDQSNYQFLQVANVQNDIKELWSIKEAEVLAKQAKQIFCIENPNDNIIDSLSNTVSKLSLGQ